MHELLSEFKQIREVLFSSDAQSLLNDGWILIGTYQRSRVYSDGIESDVVYVLGKN